MDPMHDRLARGRSRRIWRLIAAIVAATWASAGALPGAEGEAVIPAGLEATVATLPNGLKVILVEDHSAPVVSRWTFYRVGSRNERPGITGISHFIEHMMFNGADKYGPKEFDRVLESNGGYSNAYTGNDLTAYFEDASSDILELCLDLDSDRMRALAFQPELVETELAVVREERRLGNENSVDGTMYEELNALAYQAHPYGWDVVGWMSDLKGITRDDAVAYWKSYYAPNNAILIIVGDFEPQETLSRVRRYYEDIPAQPPTPPVRTREPEQKGERRAEVRMPAELPGFLVGYHIPSVTAPDICALDILQYVLTDGESSRLHRKLVRDLELAVYVYSSAQWRVDPGLFILAAKMQPGQDTAAAERAIYAELEAIAQAGVTAAELDKAKSRLLANLYRSIETVNGRADAIGTYEIYFGDYQELFRIQDRYAAVTGDDVKRVAGQYFSARNRNVVTLVPEG